MWDHHVLVFPMFSSPFQALQVKLSGAARVYGSDRVKFVRTRMPGTGLGLLDKLCDFCGLRFEVWAPNLGPYPLLSEVWALIWKMVYRVPGYRRTTDSGSLPRTLRFESSSGFGG